MALADTIDGATSFNGFVQTANASASDLVVGSLTTNGQLTGTTWTYPYGGSFYTWPENKTERAFTVIRALMKAKVVKIATLSQFFAAMDEVVKVL